MILTREEVYAACDEAHNSHGYTEAMSLAEILERMILEKLATPTAPTPTAPLIPKELPEHGEVPGVPYPDFPEEATTFRERRFYQIGVARGKFFTAHETSADAGLLNKLEKAYTAGRHEGKEAAALLMEHLAWEAKRQFVMNQSAVKDGESRILLEAADIIRTAGSPRNK